MTCQQRLLNILGRCFLLLWFVLKVRTEINPNWKLILQKLHNKVDEIYYGDHYGGHHSDRTKVAYCGKFFKHLLKDRDNFGDYEAFEEGTNTLPQWMSFDPKKNKLQGVPTEEDLKNGVKIVFRRKHENTINGLFGEPKFVVINVVTNRKPFKCPQVVSTGSIIFSANISKNTGKNRVRLMRKIANQLEQSVNNVYLEVGNRLQNDATLENGVRMAGPGDRVTSSEPGFTVTWRIKCSRDIAGDRNIGFLGQLSAKEDFSSTFREHVLGWFVHTSEEDQSFRMRRAIGVAGTPSATPTLSVVSTTTLKASPSVIVRATSTIQPSPSKSMVATSTVFDIPIVPTTVDTTPSGPRLLDVINDLYVFEHQAFEKDLRSLFYSTDNVVIELKYSPVDSTNDKPSLMKQWIEYNNNALYLFPKSPNIGKHSLELTATDTTGRNVKAKFDVYVEKVTTNYNNKFNITAGKDFTVVKKSAKEKVKLVKAIATSTNQTDYGKLRAVRFFQGVGSVIIEWGLDNREYYECDNEKIREYFKYLKSAESKKLFKLAGVNVLKVEQNNCGVVTPTLTTTEKEPTFKVPVGPKLVDNIRPIVAFEHQAFEKHLGSLFNSDDHLVIELKYYPRDSEVAVPLLTKHWIEYKNKYLYLLPKHSDIGKHKFELTATDSKKRYINAMFEVDVKKDTTDYNVIFNLTVDSDFAVVNKSAKEQVKLVKAIATNTNQGNYRKLRAVTFSPGSVIIQWGLDDREYYDCDNEKIQYYYSNLGSPSFRESFSLAGVLEVGMVVKGQCDADVISGPSIDTDQNLWQRILIPVIVIVVLLLIIALILCCVYRRKRKGDFQTEEDKAYLNHKKPVIFLEEFEEKPHFVSLQPLILPNEKPPAPGPYEPRADTPEVPGSSTTVSTESEEKPMMPQSPKDNSRKGYIAPPPYTSIS